MTLYYLDQFSYWHFHLYSEKGNRWFIFRSYEKDLNGATIDKDTLDSIPIEHFNEFVVWHRKEVGYSYREALRIAYKILPLV